MMTNVEEPFVAGIGVAGVLTRFGLIATLERHDVRNAFAGSLAAICHACGADVEMGPLLRDIESSLVARLWDADEAVAIEAWTRLLDEEPWLCEACQLLLP